MSDSVPSKCPGCGAWLDHRRTLGENSMLIVDCPECDYTAKYQRP